MNSDTAASAVSLPTEACLTVVVRKRFPLEVKAADPVPAPSNLRKTLLSTIATPPWAGHCPYRYHHVSSPQHPGLTEPNAD